MRPLPRTLRIFLGFIFFASLLMLASRWREHGARSAPILEADIPHALATGTMPDCFDNKPVRVKTPVQFLAMDADDVLLWKAFLREQNDISSDKLPEIAFYEKHSDASIDNFVLGMKKINGSYCLHMSGNSGGMEPYVLFAQKYR